MIPSDLLPGFVQLTPEGGAEKARTVDFQPWVFPPPGNLPFDSVNQTTVLAGASTTFAVVDCQSMRGVIRWFANETAIDADYDFLKWTLLFNGNPVNPFIGAMLSRGIISNPDPVLFHLKVGTTVSVKVENTGVANIVAKTRVKGWLY